MGVMNIYKISQTENTGYDTYDSAIVAAKNEDLARLIYPGNKNYFDESVDDFEYETTDWCSSPDKVIVELIGKATKSIKSGVVLSSYNAG
jgi:hypothetical protein